MLELRDIERSVLLPNGEILEILRGVNLDVEPGDHISIVGHSGTGKSTLLNVIGLLDQPNSGTYTWDGTDVLAMGDVARSKKRGASIGFVFQQFNLFPTRNAVENVAVPLLYQGDTNVLRRHSIAAELLAQVGLGDRLDAMPSQLSGGEQQRVALARALIRKPRVILADEPTGALDPHTGALVMDLLENAAHANDAALIVITHDMGVAKRANRVFEIRDGVLHDASHLPSSVLVESVSASALAPDAKSETAAEVNREHNSESNTEPSTRGDRTGQVSNTDANPDPHDAESGESLDADTHAEVTTNAQSLNEHKPSHEQNENGAKLAAPSTSAPWELPAPPSDQRGELQK